MAEGIKKEEEKPNDEDIQKSRDRNGSGEAPDKRSWAIGGSKNEGREKEKEKLHNEDGEAEEIGDEDREPTSKQIRTENFFL